MFNRTMMSHLTFFIYSLWTHHSYYKRFVYDESSNEVVTLYGLKYEQSGLDDANERDIIIVGSPTFGFPQIGIINFLQPIIHFKARLFYDQANWKKHVLTGRCDMNLEVYTAEFPYLTLHPTTSGGHQLFVINTGMIGTPTYFVELFDIYLWISFLSSFILIGILSIVGIYYLKQRTSAQFNSFTWYSMLTNQGGEENSRFLFFKIILIPTSIIAIIFHGSFGAFLSSYLAIRNLDVPFTTLDELLKFPDYSICTPKGTSAYIYFTDLVKSDLAIRARVNNKYCPKEFNQWQLTVQRYGFIDFCPMDKTVYFVSSIIEMLNVQCPVNNFRSLKAKYGKRYNSIMISPGFKYREQFNRGLIRIRSAGFIQRHESAFNIKTNRFERLAGHLEYDPAVNFHQTKLILLIPVAGILLGIIILMIERLLKN